MNPRRAHLYLLLIVGALIWGVAGAVIKFTLEGFSPGVFLAYRFLISTAVAILISVFVGLKLPRDPKILMWTLLYCFLSSTVALGILFLGYEETTAIDAGLIGATAPLLVTAAGMLFLREHITKREKIGMGIAFFGTLITILEPVLRGGLDFSGIGGNLLILLSILVGTATAVIAKVLMRENVRPIDATNLTFIVGLVTTVPIVLLFTSPAQIISEVQSAPLPYHLGVFYMAIFSGTIAYFFWHKAEKSIKIGEVGLFAYLTPLFGTPVAILWLKEQVTIPFVIGAVIIAIGVAIAEYKKSRPSSLNA